MFSNLQESAISGGNNHKIYIKVSHTDEYELTENLSWDDTETVAYLNSYVYHASPGTSESGFITSAKATYDLFGAKMIIFDIHHYVNINPGDQVTLTYTGLLNNPTVSSGPMHFALYTDSDKFTVQYDYYVHSLQSAIDPIPVFAESVAHSEDKEIIVTFDTPLSGIVTGNLNNFFKFNGSEIESVDVIHVEILPSDSRLVRIVVDNPLPSHSIVILTIKEGAVKSSNNFPTQQSSEIHLVHSGELAALQQALRLIDPVSPVIHIGSIVSYLRSSASAADFNQTGTVDKHDVLFLLKQINPILSL